MTYRVLLTASRTWRGHEAIHAVLDEIHAAHPGMVLVHGSARGGDQIADRWAALRGVPVERHPADWNRYRPMSPDRRNPAGMIRNGQMVKLGADVCVAFIADCDASGCHRPRPHGSHRAAGCADLAEAAGIPTRRWTR